jgi:hypothetical protein
MSIILSLIGLLGGGNIGALIKGVTDYAKNKSNVEGANHISDNEAGRALGAKYFDSVDKANEAKAANRPVYLVVFGLVMFAFPTGVVYTAALMDGLPWFGHAVGSWGIAIPPGLKETFQKIIDSFFISAPAAAVGVAVAQAFRRK